MKPWMPFQIQSVTSLDDLRRFTDQGFQNLYRFMNGNVGFTDNVQCSIVDTVLNQTTSTIPHNLNKVPIGFLVLNQNADANVWSGPFAWTDSNVYLVASTTLTVKLAILGG